MANAMYIPATALSYQAYSTDIVDGKITNASYKGASLYMIDEQKWYRILDDLTLAPLIYNVSTGTSGSVSGFFISGSIALGASEAHIGQIGGTGYIVSASFTGNGTATLHAANSAITPANGSLLIIPNAVRVNGGTAYVMDVTLSTSVSGITIMPKLHFYSASSVTVTPDSGSWVSLFADDQYKLGIYTLPSMFSSSGSLTNMSMATSTDTYSTSHPAILIQAQPNSKNIAIGVETLTSFTSTASQVWNVKLRMDQN